MGINILSCFDGMSCGRLALERAGIKVNKYYASEIDKYSIQVTQHNFPDTIQIGDITKIKGSDLPKIDLILAGSPCQGFSFAGKQLAFDDPRSQLFFEFIRLYKETKPKYFLLENVKMKMEHQAVISKYMDVAPIEINSALVSAQQRKRLYWTNIKNEPYGLFDNMMCMIPQPKDKGILLKDILENDVDEKYYINNENKLKFVTDKWRLDKKYTQINGDKAITQQARQYASWCGDYITLVYKCRNPENPKSREVGLNTQQQLEPRTDGKTNCLTSVQKDNLVMQLNPSKESGGVQPYQQNRVYDIKGKMTCLDTGSEHKNILSNQKIRRLTPVECERLQNVSDNYTACVSDTQRYKMLGNGWTIDVIAHILSYMK